jgi:hypothetical protein
MEYCLPTGLLEENMARMEELYRNVAVKSNAL